MHHDDDLAFTRIVEVDLDVFQWTLGDLRESARAAFGDRCHVASP